jgi:hypothetical protein
MKKKGLIILVIAVIAIIIGYIIYNNNTFDYVKGEYMSVEGQNSTYSLNIENDGKFSVSDIGVGNPVMKGRLLKIPFQDKCVFCCLSDEDFDGTFLNVNSKFKVVNYEPIKLGREMDQNFMCVIFTNGKEQIKFNQINWLHTNRKIWE